MRILITGATSGIGRQLALDYRKDGQEVWAIGRNETALGELEAKEINTGRVDLTDREGSLSYFASLPELDLAILNAGTCEYINMPEFDSQLVSRVMRANVESLAISLEGILPLLRRGKTRHLAVVGSSAAYLPLPRAEAYGASKAAAAYMTDTLRIPLVKEGFTVSLICPGFVKTPLTDKNDFPMPQRITVVEASAAIRRGLERKQAEIHFPKSFTYALKLLSLLPRGIWTRIAQKMVRA
jgi:short-subunit dehydrogenase